MKHIIIFLFLVTPFTVKSQSLDRHTIGTAGAYNEDTNAALSWTIGETMIETFANSSHTLTQGFHQGSLSVTALINQPAFGVDINVYPNPVQSRLTIEADVQGAEYRIVNMQGKVVKTGNISETALQIDLSDLSNGNYLLKIDGLNTHIIIKQ